MKLIQQFKPFTTRSKDVKLPSKGVALISLSEGDKLVIDQIWSPESPIQGSFIGYVPIQQCGVRINPSIIKEARKKGKKPIYTNPTILKTKRSVIIDISPALFRIEQKGYKYPYADKYIKFVETCLKNLTDNIEKYDYRFVYDFIDLSNLPQTFTQTELRKLRIYPIIKMLKDDEAFKDWFDETYGKIFVTFKTKVGNTINMLVYDSGHESFSKPESLLSRFVSVIKYLNRDKSTDDEIDSKTTKIISKLKEVIPDKDTREIVSLDIRQYANTYPDEVANVKLSDKKNIKKIAAKAIKAVITQDSEVSDKEVESIIRELTKIQIKPPQIPEKTTKEDVISNVRKVASPPQTGNVIEARKVAFQNLENFIKVFNTYFNKLQFRIVSVDRKPVELRDIAKTEQEMLEIVIEDLNTGKYHTIELLIPKIIDDNYFIVNGVKRVLIHQLFPLPVVSYRPGEVVIRTNFANATVTLETKNKIKSFYGLVLGKKLPMILLFILYFKSLGNTLEQLGIKYELTEDGDPKEDIKLPDGKYLKLVKASPEQKILINGLKPLKRFPEKDDFEYWMEIISNLVSHRFARQIESYFDRFIDPLTFYILKTENLPETVHGLFWYACQLAYSGVVTSQTDLRYRRIRSVEVFAVLLYKRLYLELYKYRMKEAMAVGEKRTKEKIKIPKDALLKDLTMTDAVSQYQQVDAINPVIESSYVTRVTYAGYGGIKSENVPITMRNVDPTYFGTICPVDSPECLHPDTIVYKYDSNYYDPIPTRIMDIQPGDKIEGSVGLVEVKNKQLSFKETYEIELEDGTVIVCSKDHRFPVYDTVQKMYVVLPLEVIMQDPDRYEFEAIG